ncbi:MAG: sigma-70 family RNA polymerase sigma factor [Chloroflexi bacterium]|nr:sigma-70 family RNA polymerase sigma factor [Chloroflexota bacterium]
MQPFKTLDEPTLVERAKSDPEAFGELYERHVDRIYNYIYYRVGNPDDAEDLTARTFFQALDNIGRYEHRGAPFSAWLYRIAHNLVANWHRHRSRHKTVPLDELLPTPAPMAGPSAVVEKKEAREVLLEAIHRLPEDRQQLLILKFVERLPNAQIGQVMNRSESSIKSLYHRTLIALRNDLQNRGLIQK